MLTEKQRRMIGAKNADAQVELVAKLRSIRIENGQEVVEVAGLMGVDPTMVYRLEKGGTNFTASTLRKYAKAVGAVLTLEATRMSASKDDREAEEFFEERGFATH